MSTIATRSLPIEYTWSFPGSPIQVRLRLSVVNDLQTVLDDRQRPKGIAPAACGILRGSVPRSGVTEVSGFEPVPSLHLAPLEEMCEREPDIVGFYRTTHKGGLRMSEQDLRLARSHFSRPGSVILLIEADDSGASNAAFFFWDEGRIDGDFALMEFPFDAYQLAATEQKRGKSAKPLVPVVRPSGAPSQRSRAGIRIAGVVLGGVILVGAIAGGIRFTRGQREPAAAPVEKVSAAAPVAATPPAAVAGALGLSLDQQGSKLRVYWNRQAPTILSAKFGMVVIREGARSRNVPLTADQLRSGSILYAATSDQVDIELNVVGGERVSRESITAVLPSRDSKDAVIASAKSLPASREPVRAEDKTEASAEAADKPELRKFSLPTSSGRKAPAAIAAITEPPPALKFDLGTGGPASPVAWQSATPPVPQPATPSPARSVAPLPPAPVPSPAASAPSTAQSDASTVPEPPVAIRKVAPRFPGELKALVAGPTSVQVLVKIDAAGKVTSATPAGNQKVNSLLLQVSLDAARAWTFRPATIRGTPVGGEMLLNFDFTPTR